MVLKSMSDLKGIVAGKPKKKLVLAAAQDQHSLSAVLRAWKDEIIEPIFIGDKEEIQNICSEYGYDIVGLRIIHEPEIDKSVEMAVRMLSSKQADILMKGKVGTSSLLKCVLNKEWGLRTGNLKLIPIIS
jgi:phosphate butyryltransferase